ncbi:MAG: hypothetical protein IKP53_05925 [Candidatus Methanomethylophilaceae archaeon]|nr:hypothetical protein [Candidatus Methanomethylophilaceae archaeon]
METISKAIAAVGVIAVLLGVAMAYIERHSDDLNLAFIPLILGFVAIFVFFFLIEKRGNDRYGKIKE